MNIHNLDDLTRELRRTEPYIDDAGFTAGVLARLPTARTLPLWVRNLIQLGAVIISSAIVAWELPVSSLLAQTLAGMQSVPVLVAASALPFLLAYGVVLMSTNDLV